jgi:hypothetical protein
MVPFILPENVFICDAKLEILQEKEALESENAQRKLKPHAV